MSKKSLMMVVVNVGLVMLFACSQKDIKLQTPMQDESSGKWGYADSIGKLVVPFIYEEANAFKDNLAKVKQNGKYGFIDNKGAVAIPLVYDELGDFAEGISKAMLDTKYGYLDKSGQEIIPFKYEEIGSFNDGLVKVKLNGKFGFINNVGQEVVSLKYDEIGNFVGGLVKAQLEEKYGYLSKNGEEAIPFVYESAEDFSKGKAKVQLNNKYFLISKDGTILPDEMSLIFTYQQTGQAVNGTPVAKLNSFVFKDALSGEELKYRKLVIDGKTVVGTRCYAESGMNGMNVAEFSFGGGRYKGYNVALGHSKTLKYKLENGTLTVLD